MRWQKSQIYWIKNDKGIWSKEIRLKQLWNHSNLKVSVVYSPIAFNERVTFWLQCVRSLPFACAYVALFACEAHIKPFNAITLCIQCSKHICTRLWQGALKPKSYSLVEGNRTLAGGKSDLDLFVSEDLLVELVEDLKLFQSPFCPFLIAILDVPLAPPHKNQFGCPPRHLVLE